MCRIFDTESESPNRDQVNLKDLAEKVENLSGLQTTVDMLSTYLPSKQSSKMIENNSTAIVPLGRQPRHSTVSITLKKKKYEIPVPPFITSEEKIREYCVFLLKSTDDNIKNTWIVQDS